MNNMINNIKVFFVDLDGTLIDEKHHKISPDNLQTIHDLQKSVHVILSTGRMGQNLEKYMRLTKVPYAVAANGAQIIDKNNNIIWSKIIDNQVANFIFEFARKNKLSFKVDDEKVAYGVNNVWSRLICKILDYQIIKHRKFNGKNLHKIVLWGKSRYKIKKLLNELKKIRLDASFVSSSKGYTIEITHRQATKGRGNEFVWKNLLKIKDVKQTAHIGDSMNDSTVIGFIGTFIAMKNSPRSLIKLADYLGPNYRRGGFAKIFKGANLKKLRNN